MQNVSRNRASFIDQLNPFVNRIFQHAVMQGDMAVVTLMLKHGVIVRRNQRNPYGLTALQQSVLDGNSRLVFMLLESDADMEAKTSNGWTCLHIASAAGDVRMVKLLLAHCADVVALTNNEELPIDLAMNMDLKILLANEMSRCGYIELSQWYMNKITQQDSGVFYVMSADSLLDIACDRQDPFSSTGYDFYNQNCMQTYSSMINLSNHSRSDVNLASHKARKPSTWSLSQQNQFGSNLTTYSYTLPAHGRLEQMFSNPIDTSVEKQRDVIRKSSSSASVLERNEYIHSQACKEEFGSNRKMSDIPAVSTPVIEQNRSIVNVPLPLTVNNADNTIGLGNRKNSLRRKKSSNYTTNQGYEIDNRVELTIDYFQNSIDYEDAYENEDEYLEFLEERRPRIDSSSSGSSFDEAQPSNLTEDYCKDGNGEKLYEDSNLIAGDRELLQEFADPYSSNSQFEIDTDNIDQYIIKSDGSVLRLLAEPDVETSSSVHNLSAVIETTDLKCQNGISDQPEISHERSIVESGHPDLFENRQYSTESSSNGNMYFNPMYKSTDTFGLTRNKFYLKSEPDESSSNSSLDSEQDVTLTWQSNEADSTKNSSSSNSSRPRTFDRSPTTQQPFAKGKPYEIYSEETELICNETEFIERKRKKKGIFSELVSRLKKGSTKMQRTSSDTNLHENEDCSIIRRDTRKVKTLRRRRHVRRSNSFSSYFTQDEKGGKTDPAKKDEKKKSNDRSNSNVSHDGIRLQDNREIPPPYSPHRKKKMVAELTESTSYQRGNQMCASLPHRGSRANRSAQIQKNSNALGYDDSWLQIQNYQQDEYCSWEPAVAPDNPAGNWNNDSGPSKIPTRSVNTFVKENKTLPQSEGQSNEAGCVPMKLLCNV